MKGKIMEEEQLDLFPPPDKPELPLLIPPKFSDFAGDECDNPYCKICKG